MRWILNSRVPTVLTIYLAALALVVFVCSLVGLAVGRDPNQFWRLQATREGDLTLRRHTAGGRAPESYDIQFHPLGTTPFLKPQATLELVYIGEPPGRALHLPWDVVWFQSYSIASDYLVEAEEVPGSNRLWFWLPDRRVFEAYDAHTRLLVGRLGADGFRATGQVEPFRTKPGAGLSMNWLVRRTTWLALPERGRVDLVHLADRTVRTLVKVADGERPGVAVTPPFLYPDTRPLPERLCVFVRSAAILECYDFAGRRLAAVPLTEKERAAWALRVGRADDGTLILAASYKPLDIDGTSVRRVTPAGKTLEEHVLKVPKGMSWPPFPGEVANRLTACAAVLWLAAQPFMTYWGTSVTRTWSLLAGVAVALVSALVIAGCARRSRLSAGRRLAWTAFALVGGLPAVVAYFAAADLPPTERCQRCGRRKPVSQEVCSSCGAPVPAPEPTGVEIFE